MSAGFTEQQKEEIRKKLISAGKELAVTIGFKKMTVALVAKSAGVAVGSFYNFFESKESFALAIIRDTGEQHFQSVTAGMKDGRIPLDKFLDSYRDFFRPENNFMLNIRLEDWAWLMSHISDKSVFTDPANTAQIAETLKYIDGVRPDADIAVVVNFIKTIYAAYQNKDILYERALQTNVDLIFDAIYRYMKGE